MFKLDALLGLARRFLAESLFKNSAFLMLNLVLTTVCGYGALTLLTHLFSAKDVGLSATAVAACSLVTFITQLGTTYSLPRYLPTAKNRSEMINTLLTAVTVSTLVGSVIFLALPSSRNLFVLGGWVFCLVFVATAVLQALQTVLGDRSWSPTGNRTRSRRGALSRMSPSWPGRPPSPPWAASAPSSPA